MPLVSIIMPMRNAQSYVADALASVLAERRIDVEVVVIDDGSSDRSRNIVHGIDDPRIRVIDGPERGIAAAMNVGIGSARGEFVTRCDADDLYTPNRLHTQAEWLSHHTDFAAICGGYSTMDSGGRTVRDLDCGRCSEEISEELRSGVTRTHLCTYMIRRDTLKLVGGFRSFFVTAEDIDLQLRLGQQFRVWFDPRSCYVYRIHDDSMTHGQQSGERAFFESTARKFAAQRRATGTDDLETGNPPNPRFKESRRTSAREHIQGQLQGLAWKQHCNGQFRKAIATGLRACLAHPARLSAWKSLAALILKRSRTEPETSERP